MRAGDSFLHDTDGVDPASAGGQVRDLRLGGQGGSPPRPEAQRPFQTGAAGEAILGAVDGCTQAEDARRLREMPRRHPCREAGWSPKRGTEGMTGEPDAAKVARPVRRGADGKGAARPPRRPPTLLRAGAG